jgi:hypothetical protein
MIKYKYLLAAVLICAIAAGVYAAWQGYVKHDIRATDVSVTPTAKSAWYLSSGKFASCVESSGPDQKIQEVHNSGEDPTVVDDNQGMVQVMREGPPEQWNFFKTKQLCDAYNEAGRSGAVKSETP